MVGPAQVLPSRRRSPRACESCLPTYAPPGLALGSGTCKLHSAESPNRPYSSTALDVAACLGPSSCPLLPSGMGVLTAPHCYWPFVQHAPHWFPFRPSTSLRILFWHPSAVHLFPTGSLSAAALPFPSLSPPAWAPAFPLAGLRNVPSSQWGLGLMEGEPQRHFNKHQTQ